ncbi:MAG: hypothetical protein WD038_09970 [Balneolales bacterium]
MREQRPGLFAQPRPAREVDSRLIGHACWSPKDVLRGPGSGVQVR